MQRSLWIGASLAFAGALCDAVNRVVLCGRSDAIVFLHGLCHLDAESGNKIRVFAVSVLDSSPTLISRHVQCRRINIRIAKSPRLERGYSPDLAH